MIPREKQKYQLLPRAPRSGVHWTGAGEEVSLADSHLENLLSSVHWRDLFEKEVLTEIVSFQPQVRWSPETKGSCRICLLPKLDETRAV